jgi:Fur family zinc uptake transcriptional regulator
MLKAAASDMPLACRPHDHSHCVNHALETAEVLCEQRGLRLTALRKRVLELVWASHKPLGAYDILAELSEIDGRRAAPPTVYRALDFLLEHGLVHRIASLNAFVGCNHPGQAHQGQFLICRNCHAAVELQHSSIDTAVLSCADSVGFSVEGQTVEISGLCAACKAVA